MDDNELQRGIDAIDFFTHHFRAIAGLSEALHAAKAYRTTMQQWEAQTAVLQSGLDDAKRLKGLADEQRGDAERKRNAVQEELDRLGEQRTQMIRAITKLSEEHEKKITTMKQEHETLAAGQRAEKQQLQTDNNALAHAKADLEGKVARLQRKLNEVQALAGT